MIKKEPERFWNNIRKSLQKGSGLYGRILLKRSFSILGKLFDMIK